MTVEVLIDALRTVESDYGGDPEAAHAAADVFLLAYIDNDEVTTAFESIKKWYA